MFGKSGSPRCAIGGFWRVSLLPSHRSSRRSLWEFRLGISGNSHRESFRIDPIFPYFHIFAALTSSSSDSRPSDVRESPGGMSTFRVAALAIDRDFLLSGSGDFPYISTFFRDSSARDRPVA